MHRRFGESEPADMTIFNVNAEGDRLFRYWYTTSLQSCYNTGSSIEAEQVFKLVRM